MEKPSNPIRLPRTPALFVGRKTYLSAFEDCLKTVMLGQPCVWLIEGEAGLGKTRLLKEMRSVAEHVGMRICVGRGYEDITIPYLPFVQAFQSQWTRLPDDLERNLGPDLDVIRRLLQEDGYTTPITSLAMAGQDDHDKLRLFLAVSHFAIMLAQCHPTLMVFDDLHWVDAPSLDLFSYLVSTIAERMGHDSLPLMMVATYRPVDSKSKLARVASRVQREALCQRHHLSGFDAIETRALLRGLGVARPSQELLSIFADLTQGSPLFIEETLYYLMAQHVLYEQDGYAVSALPAVDLRLPNHITEMIFARTQGVSQSCHAVLTLAAFLGEHFTLMEITAAIDLPPESLLSLLEEGMHHGLLVNEGQTFQFTHPLVRHVFYQAPSAVRRQLLHHQIAEALEQLYEGMLEPHLLKIAYHFVRAGPHAKQNTVFRYARQAGDWAFAVYAWHEAAHYYTAALAAAEPDSLLPRQERADLHYLAGLAHLWDGDVSPSLRHYDQALAGYRLTGDHIGLARALLAKTHAYPTAVTYGTFADMRQLEAVLETLQDDELALQGQILNGIAQVYWVARRPDKVVELGRRALALGLQLQDHTLCAFSCFQVGVAYVQQLLPEEAFNYYQQARFHARQAKDLWLESWPLQRMTTSLILLGRFEEVETIALEARELASQTNNWGHYSLTLATLASVAAARGEFARAEQYAQEALEKVSRFRYPFGGALAIPALASTHMMRGYWAKAQRAIDLLVEPGAVFDDPGPLYQAVSQAYRALVAAHQAHEAPKASLPPLNGACASLPEELDVISLSSYCALVERQALREQTDGIDQVYTMLSTVAARGVEFSRGWVFSIQRILGLAAALQGLANKAAAHYQAALDITTRLGARSELARTRFDYAQLLACQDDHDQTEQALQYAQEAECLFAELEMGPFTARATRLIQHLQTRLGHPPLASLPAGSDSLPGFHHLAILTQITQEETAFLG